MVTGFFLLFFCAIHIEAFSWLANKSANMKNLCIKRIMRF